MGNSYYIYGVYYNRGYLYYIYGLYRRVIHDDRSILLEYGSLENSESEIRLGESSSKRRKTIL